jgi:hypothetical protein
MNPSGSGRLANPGASRRERQPNLRQPRGKRDAPLAGCGSGSSHFGREANREGIPLNMIAEIDMAQDTAELDDTTISEKVRAFLKQDFSPYDADLKNYQAEVPQVAAKVTKLSDADIVQSEVTGCAPMFWESELWFRGGPVREGLGGS